MRRSCSKAALNSTLGVVLVFYTSREERIGMRRASTRLLLFTLNMC